MRAIGTWAVQAIVALAAVFAACSAGAESKQKPARVESVAEGLAVPREKGSGRLPIFCEYINHRSNAPGRTVGPRLVLAVFADGRWLTTADGKLGGPPYREGKLTSEQVATLEADLRQVIAISPVAQTHFGPDSSTSVLVGWPGGGGLGLSLESWHEGFENSGTLLGTQDGVVALEGRAKEEVQRTWSDSYRVFRAQWMLMRMIQRDYTPTGKLVSVDTEAVEFVPYTKDARAR